MIKSTLLLAVAASFTYLLHNPPAGAALAIQEAEALKLYGGVYSTECGNPAAPRLHVAETLNVEHGNKRMTGGNLMAAASYFGPEPPPGYQTALISEVRGGAQLLFVVYRDKGGLYIELMGDPLVEKSLKAMLGTTRYKSRFRDCDVSVRTSLPQPAQAASPDPDSVAGWDHVRDKTFKAIHHKALGAKAREPWIRALDGPSPGARTVTAAGAEYRMLAVCKPHDCGDNNLVLLYSPARRLVYGTIHERGKTTLIGKPPPEVAAELERLWKAEWRQGN